MEENILEKVVSNNLCIGCGVCAAICPNNSLRVDFNEFGEYIAYKQGPCIHGCDTCLRVCPFSDQDETEDFLGAQLFRAVPEIKHTPETGYYLDAFVGYSKVNGHRESGASGGMATWTLEKLLKEKLVDYVTCVSRAKDSNKLYNYVICSTTQEVRHCSKSCYYPVEISEIIRHMLSNKGRYAVIGLPCFCKAIRLATEVSPKLRRRVKFLLGLACGQTKSKFFTEYICSLGGGEPDHLEGFTFRVKEPSRPAPDYGMRFAWRSKNGLTHEKVVFCSEGIGAAWEGRYFTPNACNFCDDVFAELADICFMDAWLPRYSNDWKGHNIILVRDRTLWQILNESAKSGLISLKNIDIKEVIKSQLGQIYSKRMDIKERIRFAKKQGKAVPRKREPLCNLKPPLTRKCVVRAQYLISQESGKAWVTAKKNLPRFLARLKPYATRLRIASVLSTTEQVSKGIIRRLKRILLVR